MVAFAVDMGFITVARTELQRSADAAAVAASWRLIGDTTSGASETTSSAVSQARATAAEYSFANQVCSAKPLIDTNTGNASNGDVVIGYLSDWESETLSLDFSNLANFNTVQVRVRRDATLNGEIPLFFARVLGQDSISVEATATAAILKNIGGFEIPAGGDNLGILPFALDEPTWEEMEKGASGDPNVVQDSWTREWNSDTNEWDVNSGGDGTYEVNLYPKGTGSPGNRGTVDIGSSNNSTNDIARQVVDGVNASDLDHHGGKLEFNADGKLFLNGDTGISAGIKDELASIIGQPRIIPVFRAVNGPGNNATYTIVKWAGVTITDVKLTGSNNSKRVIIQPANVVTRGAVPSTTTGTSSFIYSPGHLIR